MTSDELTRRLECGQEQFEQIKEALDGLKTSVTSLHVDVGQVKKDLHDTKEIVEAWNALKIGGKFVRWVAPILTACIGAWLYIKGWFIK